MLIYEGAFVNTETDIDNENIQQIISVRLFDTETVIAAGGTAVFFFHIVYRVYSNGDGTQTVFVNWNTLPEFATSPAFGYQDGVDWVDTEMELTGPAIITIPEGDYNYSFVIDGTRHELNGEQTVDLEMGETPLLFSTVDNDEDKFTVVKSKQVEIQIYSSDTVDISKFAEGGDNRFYVEIETQAEGIIFMGFLSVSDLRQEFLPDPNIIILTATDGLGFLNDEPLVNFSNENPTDKHTIISFLSWALAKTGLRLDIKACMNIREEFATPLVSDDTGDGHFYKYIYLDAKTFEEEIGVSENCFTVLEKILGENSFIQQYKREWIIIRPDEMEAGHEYFFTRFDHEGNFIDNTEETFSKDIGADYLMGFMNDDAEISLERPYKSIVETYNYNYPIEFVCNIDFERGDFIEDLPDETIDDITYQVKSYRAECWTEGRYFWDSPVPESTAMVVYVKRLFFNDYETQRFVVLEAANETLPSAYLRSYFGPISKGDTGTVSVDFKYSPAPTGSEIPVFGIMLVGDNGDVYDWGDSGNGWNLAFNHSAINFAFMDFAYPSEDSKEQFNTKTTTFTAAPESGRLYIFLKGQLEIDSYYSNISIDIVPFINGSYRRYEGQEHKVEQENSNIKAVREKEVFVSDAPRIAMKGALLKRGAGLEIYSGIADFGNVGQIEIDGDVSGSFIVGQTITVSGSVSNNITATITDVNYSAIGDITEVLTDGTTTTEINANVVITIANYVLSGRFYNAAKLPSGPTADDLFPYGQIQAFDIWNQFNRVMRTFEGTIDKTDSDNELPDLLHKYIMRDINPNTTNGTTQYRIFQLLHSEMNMHLCEWNGFFHEVFNTDVEKDYTGHSFKYITQ